MQKVMLGLNFATGLGEPLMAGLTVAVGGLTAGLASAGAGLGAFGIVAKTVWTEAATASTAYAAAQQKLSLATTSAQRTSALQAEKAALEGLSPPVKSLAMEIGNVQGEWKKFTNAAAPGVVGVISQALGILPEDVLVAGRSSSARLRQPSRAARQREQGAVVGRVQVVYLFVRGGERPDDHEFRACHREHREGDRRDPEDVPAVRAGDVRGPGQHHGEVREVGADPQFA